MPLSTLINTSASSLVSALLAPPCAVCDAILDSPLHGCVCRNCWGLIRPITPPICDKCGDPLAHLAGTCPGCEGRDQIIQRLRAIGEYEGVLREIIHAFKYSGRHSIAPPLAAHMRTRGTDVLRLADGVVPVPLHWRRKYERGFNQARLLARHLGLPLIDALVRRRHTKPQVELAAETRRSNVTNAFVLRMHHESLVAGMRLVIVDDVSTTGATLEACAKALMEAGAREVSGLTAARVVSRRRHDLVR
jgi:ComF family protein